MQTKAQGFSERSAGNKRRGSVTGVYLLHHTSSSSYSISKHLLLRNRKRSAPQPETSLVCNVRLKDGIRPTRASLNYKQKLEVLCEHHNGDNMFHNNLQY